jgi:hypothetical protein
MCILLPKNKISFSIHHIMVRKMLMKSHLCSIHLNLAIHTSQPDFFIRITLFRHFEQTMGKRTLLQLGHENSSID